MTIDPTKPIWVREDPLGGGADPSSSAALSSLAGPGAGAVIGVGVGAALAGASASSGDSAISSSPEGDGALGFLCGSGVCAPGAGHGAWASIPGGIMGAET